MFFFWEIVIAFILAIMLAGVLSTGLRRRGPGPWAGLIFFFIILFLAMLAGGAWVQVDEPLVYQDIAWFPMVMIGVIFMLIIAALIPARPVEETPPPAEVPAEAETEAEAETAEAAGVALSIFFWLLLILLLAAWISSLF